ncbi:hypothetical protein AVEN_39996-1 [Araneus ventricosus]|uniref:Uncharacterized protein n=1 Tax=Araneus ventricosus TaxID=182803 RepID=A0A4Y2Q3R8_ARAVE|nr:hypothetical protein AVEN_39996-1 [Araneus ventricosus]
MDFIIRNHGHMTRKTPEPAPPVKTSAPHQGLPCPSLWTSNPMGESVDVSCGHHTRGGRLAPMYDLKCTRPTNAEDLQWNPVSKLDLSSFEVETLPLGHQGPRKDRTLCHVE